MAGEWKPTTIGEQITLQRGFDITKAEQRAGTVPVVSSGGISSYHDSAQVKRPGIVIGRKGTLGTVFYLEGDHWPHDTTLWVKDFHGNDVRFVYYFLRYMTDEFLSLDVGSANPTLNRNHVHPLTIDWPTSIDEQRAIARVLGALDDKIELNRRLNATLEGLARAVFRSWFVDFDPVVAKAAGRRPVGMTADTAALFPSTFEHSPLGPIPKGWSIKTLAELTSKIGSGSTPTGGSSVYTQHGVALIRSQNVYDHEFEWAGLAYLGTEAAEKLRGVTVQQGDVLLNITGDSILRTCVVDPDVLPARVNQHVAIIRAQAGIPPRFLHLHLVRQEMKDNLIGHDAGGTRAAITKAHLQVTALIVPPGELLRAFQQTSDPVFTRIEMGRGQNRTLASLRDALLPRLLSGELRLKDVERAVGEVV